VQRISLITEGEQKRVRMAHLAFIGSHHVNGVSALHTELLGRHVFSDLLKVAPTKLVNKTNGISFRRWLFKANDGLTRLLIDTIGDRFLDAPERLADLAEFAEDRNFIDAYRKVRIANKARLRDALPDGLGNAIDTTALFDVHIKRIHEYKRQLLNVLEAVALYQEIRANPKAPIPQRIKIIAGKAAPAYWRAKEIIKLANDVANVINDDPTMEGRLQMIFVPNYGVSIAERLIPAADLSEQISTAGMEASGTGNMKLALNGALTIGTLDGANIEIRERVGADHFFLFGMTAGEVEQRKAERFEGAVAASKSPRLKRVLDSIAAGDFSKNDADRFAAVVRDLLAYDPFMVAADFDAYWAAQRQVDQAWVNVQGWWRSSILNTAHVSHFSSDRAVREYADEIWQVPLSEPFPAGAIERD
jgi:starch phosphorylase